jgi:hypothetical protein
MEGWIMGDIRTSALGGTPFGNNAGRPSGPIIGQPYFNGEEKRLELYTSTGWQNIVSETPGVVSVSATYGEIGTATLQITGTNFGTGAIASVIGTNGIEVQAASTTVNSIVSVTATFTGLSYLNDPYDVKVTNTSNLFGLLPDGFNVNQSPVWQTASGSLGSYGEQISITLSALSATDPESSTITYSVAPGFSLPSGVTLNTSTGVLSGSLPNITTNTTYTFTINASDGVNTIPRSFSINSLVLPTISGGTSASGSTYGYKIFKSNDTLVVSDASLSADVLVIAGGGGGGAGWYAGGGGAGGVKLYSGLTLTPASYGVIVGNGGLGSVNTSQTAASGANSSFNSTYSATGGGGGASRGQDVSGSTTGGSGGSGGGAAYPMTLGGTGVSGQGFNGGSNDNGGYGAAGGGSGAAGSSGNTTPPYGVNGAIGTNSYSSWISDISSAMSSVSGWTSATSTGRIAAGGAGGSTSTNVAQGGVGGGGNGSAGDVTAATNGITNTGSGGGAGSNGEGGQNNVGGTTKGATGGSGLVIVRYLKSAAVA